MTTTLDKLYALRERLSDPAKWWKGVRGDLGYSPDGNSVCLFRAAGLCDINCVGLDGAARALGEAIHRLFPGAGEPTSVVDVAAFNCHADTRHADILMVIDAAILSAGGEVPMLNPERHNRKEVAVV